MCATQRYVDGHIQPYEQHKSTSTSFAGLHEVQRRFTSAVALRPCCSSYEFMIASNAIRSKTLQHVQACRTCMCVCALEEIEKRARRNERASDCAQWAVFGAKRFSERAFRVTGHCWRAKVRCSTLNARQKSPDDMRVNRHRRRPLIGSFICVDLAVVS